jgi:hypothetical protein
MPISVDMGLYPTAFSIQVNISAEATETICAQRGMKPPDTAKVSIVFLSGPSSCGRLGYLRRIASDFLGEGTRVPTPWHRKLSPARSGSLAMKMATLWT